MNSPLAHRVAAELHPDASRVIAKLFLPGEELHLADSRAGAIVARILDLDETHVEQLAAELLADFSDRHDGYTELLHRHASIVAAHVGTDVPLSPARTLLLGASFTAEYAIEAAALCNPSATLHPDQSELAPGQVRVAVSLRGIGEGHVSSIGFAVAIIGPGPAWTFDERTHPVVAGIVTAGRWRRVHLRAVLADQGHIDELAAAVLHALPPRFDSVDLERELTESRPDLFGRHGGQATVDLLRRLVASAYEVEFAADVALAQRVLLPSVADESNGMEDARFTRFVDDNGAVDYRATYTAYDGHRISPRLLVSRDLRVFQAHRLAGPAARNKGMALFPRRVGGQYLALCRTDGESISLASSSDGLAWSEPRLIHWPAAAWEVVQVGNCGPPIETERGWLVLTHGVGPMRTYAMGALLLDLDEPSKVIGRLDRPLLEPIASERDGYVPDVVYSCGGLVHDGRLWVPYGIDDSRIGVAWVSMTDLLARLLEVG